MNVARLAVVALCCSGTFAGHAQDRALTDTEKQAVEAFAREGKREWEIDFWNDWPAADDPFRDVYMSTGSDALALGYELDPRSLSPRGFLGVIVPRIESQPHGRAFLVELPTRRVVGVLPPANALAFAEGRRVGWRYHWAPDGAALILELTAENASGWKRTVLSLFELRDGFIAREVNLLAEPRRVPPWFDAAQAPTQERSTLPPLRGLQTFADSAAEEERWTLQREASGGPLYIGHPNRSASPLPPTRAHFTDAAGKTREASADEIPGLAISFFSPDQRWLVVNQIVRTDTATGEQWRTAVLYRRVDAEGVGAKWELATPERLDELFVAGFAREEKVPTERVAPPTADGWRDRTLEFVAWSQDSGRALFYFRARNGEVMGPEGRPAYFRWFAYFNTKTGLIETTMQCSSANEELKTRWTTSSEEISRRNLPLHAPTLGMAAFFAPTADVISFHDNSLNTAYKTTLKRLPAAQAEKVRQEQRHWLSYRDTIAWAHVANRWTRFADGVAEEGVLLATRERAQELKTLAIERKPGPNAVVRETSPDRKFGIRYIYAEDNLEQDGRPEGVALVALPSEKEVVDLYDDSANQSLQGLWSPDSQYLAFHASSRRVAGITIYARRGGNFEALKMPEFDRYSPKLKPGQRESHFLYKDVEAKRWLGSSKLLVHYGISFETEMANGEAGGEVSADYDVVLAISPKGVINIEKATKTKAP